jgi:hypothetical protein
MSWPLVLCRGAEKAKVMFLAVAYVPDHYVGGEAPGVVGVNYDLGAVCIVSGLAGLPALVEDPGRHDEGANGRQKLRQHRDVHDYHFPFLGFYSDV